jgi:hypothetical protein
MSEYRSMRNCAPSECKEYGRNEAEKVKHRLKGAYLKEAPGGDESEQKPIRPK